MTDEPMASSTPQPRVGGGRDPDGAPAADPDAALDEGAAPASDTPPAPNPAPDPAAVPDDTDPVDPAGFGGADGRGTAG